MRPWARTLRQIREAYHLERVCDPTGSRRADLADAILTWLTDPQDWPRTRRFVRRLDPAHTVTGSMLRAALQEDTA
jgi:hypothetical protein